MRSLLLFLSRQKQLRQWMETSPAARRLATRFVAGETLEEALTVARKLNSEGISFAVANVSGFAARALEKLPARSPESLRRALLG